MKVLQFLYIITKLTETRSSFMFLTSKWVLLSDYQVLRNQFGYTWLSPIEEWITSSFLCFNFSRSCRFSSCNWPVRFDRAVTTRKSTLSRWPPLDISVSINFSLFPMLPLIDCVNRHERRWLWINGLFKWIFQLFGNRRARTILNITNNLD